MEIIFFFRVIKMGKINQNQGIRVVPWAKSSNHIFNILNSVTPVFEPYRNGFIIQREGTMGC